ncbi:MAG: hypothetical protein IPM71_05840 [Bacteroidota bacterium]|nr:MAG: hypothetical protein IPM71_05840 [Bacteroidota bacterium]
MEDYIEILIYVLFIAVSVIGGLYKNYAKKKEEQMRRTVVREREVEPEYSKPYASPTERPIIPTTLEEFLAQHFDLETVEEEKEPESIEGNYKDRKQEIPLDRVESTEGTAVFESTRETLLSDINNESDYSRKGMLQSQVMEEIDEDFIKTSEKALYDQKVEEFHFDAKQAVIYSEILKRQDFYS